MPPHHETSGYERTPHHVSQTLELHGVAGGVGRNHLGYLLDEVGHLVREPREGHSKSPGREVQAVP